MDNSGTTIDPQRYVDMLLEWSAHSPCSRDKRGAIIVDASGTVLGAGYNAPVGGTCSPAVCHAIKFSHYIQAYDEEEDFTYPKRVNRERGCSQHVEHAEAMAIRRAVVESVAKACRADRDSFDDRLARGEYAPLLDCEMIHLNTEPFLSDVIAGDKPRRLAKPSRRRGCPSCAVQMYARGIGAVWLLHDDGWTRYTMDEYARMAGVLA
jgi:hypothetical protein